MTDESEEAAVADREVARVALSLRRGPLRNVAARPGRTAVLLLLVIAQSACLLSGLYRS